MASATVEDATISATTTAEPASGRGGRARRPGSSAPGDRSSWALSAGSGRAPAAAAPGRSSAARHRHVGRCRPPPASMLRLPHGVVTTAVPRYDSRVADDRPELGDLLMRVARTQRRRWREALAPWDLSPHQARALRVVSERDGVRLSDLAEALHIAPRSATEVADGLQERGLVERHAGSRRPAGGARCARPSRAGGSATRSAAPGRPTTSSCSRACRPTTARPSPACSRPCSTDGRARRRIWCRGPDPPRRARLPGPGPTARPGAGSLGRHRRPRPRRAGHRPRRRRVGAGAARRRATSRRTSSSWSGRCAARRTSTAAPTCPRWRRRSSRSPTPTPASASSTRPSR